MQALVLVDIQNDFMPGGALSVPLGDEVVAVANVLSTRFDVVVGTQDWHPAGHASFASAHPGHKPGDVVRLGDYDQVLWPDHCVQGSPGASFHSALNVGRIIHVVRKGTDSEIDSYSAFFDNRHLKATELESQLRSHGVDHVVLAGLATDYCVLATAIDGIELGFDVTVVTDGCRAVDLVGGDGERALIRMRDAGCRLVSAGEVRGGRRA